MGFGRVISKYAPVVLFPTFTVVAILTDYLHTRKWKIEQQKS